MHTLHVCRNERWHWKTGYWLNDPNKPAVPNSNGLSMGIQGYTAKHLQPRRMRIKAWLNTCKSPCCWGPSHKITKVARVIIPCPLAFPVSWETTSGINIMAVLLPLLIPTKKCSIREQKSHAKKSKTLQLPSVGLLPKPPKICKSQKAATSRETSAGWPSYKRTSFGESQGPRGCNGNRMGFQCSVEGGIVHSYFGKLVNLLQHHRALDGNCFRKIAENWFQSNCCKHGAHLSPNYLYKPFRCSACLLLLAIFWSSVLLRHGLMWWRVLPLDDPTFTKTSTIQKGSELVQFGVQTWQWKQYSCREESEKVPVRNWWFVIAMLEFHLSPISVPSCSIYELAMAPNHETEWSDF